MYKAFYIAVAALLAKDGILLVDEVETGIHNKALEHFIRERVWNVLRPYRMKLLRLAPAKFIHFGTTREILELMSGGVDEYRELGWSRLIGSSIKGSETAGYNSVLSSRADIGKLYV